MLFAYCERLLHSRVKIKENNPDRITSKHSQNFMEMNTDSQIHNIGFINHDYMFRLPQPSHHQAVKDH